MLEDSPKNVQSYHRVSTPQDGWGDSPQDDQMLHFQDRGIEGIEEDSLLVDRKDNLS